MPLIVVVWIFSYPKLVKQQTEEVAHEIQSQTESNYKKQLGWLWIPINILAVFDNLVKDGLTLLPILAIFGTSVEV